jgi:hypothetical protein
VTAGVFLIAAGIFALAALNAWQAWMRHSDSRLQELTLADIVASQRPHVDPLTIMAAENGRPPIDDADFDQLKRDLER